MPYRTFVSALSVELSTPSWPILAVASRLGSLRGTAVG